MGGFGSGRSGWRIKVEDCLTLSMYWLQREGKLNSWMGTLTWRWKSTGEETGSVSFRVDHGNDRFILQYTKTLQGEKRHVEDPIPFHTTGAQFGGVRYWFNCPSCWRRCAKLYLPPGGLYFRCRLCYHLTYESCKESRKYDRLFSMLAAETGGSISDVKRALKALQYRGSRNGR
jgi:hypothetical protein